MLKPLHTPPPLLCTTSCSLVWVCSLPRPLGVLLVRITGLVLSTRSCGLFFRLRSSRSLSRCVGCTAPSVVCCLTLVAVFDLVVLSTTEQTPTILPPFVCNRWLQLPVGAELIGVSLRRRACCWSCWNWSWSWTRQEPQRVLRHLAVCLLGRRETCRAIL